MSVYKDEKGNWYCVFRYKDFSGKTIQKKKRGFKTKREAKEFETEYQKKAAGQADMTFQSLTELYLADCKARHKPNIYENEKTRARLALLPFFGDMKVKDITAAHIRNWQNEFLIPHYMPSTAHKHNQDASAIFNYGIRYCNLTTNPVVQAGRIHFPDKLNDSTEIRFWTRDDFEKFISFVQEPMYRIAYQIMFWTGIRRGEMCGLRLCDIDIEKRQIQISRNRVVIIGSGTIIQTPKTRTSYRVIGITPKLTSEIESYIGSLYEPNPDDLLFTPSPDSLTKHFLRHQRRHEITPQIHLHDLRHSHASLLINMGISPKAVADRLGHANEMLVMRVYGHLYPERRNEIVDKLSKIE